MLGIVRRAQGPQVAEARQAHRRDGLLASARKRRVGITVADQPIRLPHAMRACGTGRDDARAIALQPVADREVSRRHVLDHGGNEQGAYLFRPALAQSGAPRFELLQAADAAAPHAGEALGILVFHLDAGMRHGLVRGDDGILHEGRKTARLLFRQAACRRIEIGDLRGERGGKARRIEAGDGADAAFARIHRIHQGGRAYARGRDGADAGDGDAMRAVRLARIRHSDIPPSTPMTWPVT